MQMLYRVRDYILTICWPNDLMIYWTDQGIYSWIKLFLLELGCLQAFDKHV